MPVTAPRFAPFCAAVLASLTIIACVPPATSSGARPPRTSPVELSRSEIDREHGRFGTAYEMILALRPNMLASREIPRQAAVGQWQTAAPRNSTMDVAGVRIYIDGMFFGGVRSLSMIPASSVREVHWLSPLDATTRYGGGHTSGAILVTTRNGR